MLSHPSIYRDGTLSPQANSTKTFARLLANRAVELGMAEPWRDDDEGQGTTRAAPFVFLWDERLTSQAARVNIKTKAFLHRCTLPCRTFRCTCCAIHT